MKYPLLALIKLYQWTISPLLGPVCRYYPSCSHYGYTAIDRHGAVKGTALTAWRILRCNPWSPGGVDHVPPRKRPRWHELLREPCVAARADSAADVPSGSVPNPEPGRRDLAQCSRSLISGHDCQSPQFYHHTVSWIIVQFHTLYSAIFGQDTAGPGVCPSCRWWS